MKKNLAIIFSSLLLLLSLNKAHAQESMMNDISYPYLQKLIDAAKENYPMLKIKQEQVEIAKTTYKQSKFAWFNALSLSYVYSPENAVNLTSNNSVGTSSTTGNTVNPNIFAGYQAAITLNVGTLIANPFNTKNAKSAYTVAQLEQQAYDATLETQVKRLYFTFVQAQENLKARSQAMQEIGTMYTQIKRQFEKNTVTMEVYSQATISYATANQAKIDSEANYLIAKGALEEIVGKKIEEIK
jgi:outer membrane protein TolC